MSAFIFLQMSVDLEEIQCAGTTSWFVGVLGKFILRGKHSRETSLLT